MTTFEPDYARVERDPRAAGVFWMFEAHETRPFGHLEVAVLDPVRWGVKVMLARDDLAAEDVVPIVARALIQVMDCKADVVEVFVASSGTTHQLVNVGSRFV